MTYARPADRAGALRLHLNENTAGCSEAVIDAIRAIAAEDVAYYPDYSELSRECAAYLGVSEAQLVLTNGLDEGLLALAVSAFRSAGELQAPEAIVPAPAFEMYSVFVKAAGGRVVSIPPKPGFAFQLDEICAAIGSRTRIIFLTNPNNPTGQLIPRDAIREIVRRAPAGVTIAIDEAYFDFCGETFLPSWARRRMSSLDGRSRRRMAWPVFAPAASSATPQGSTLSAVSFRRIASACLPSPDGARHCGIAITSIGIARRCPNRESCSMRHATGSGFPTGRAQAISC